MGFGFEMMIIAAMLLVNAVFAAYEMALASISKVKLGALVNLKRRGAKEAFFMKERMEGSLAVVQLGITLAGAIAAAIGGAGIDEHLAPVLKSQWGLADSTADILALVFFIIPLSCLTIIFAELIPKTFAIKHQAKVCLMLSPVMKVLAMMAYPVISLLEGTVKKVMKFLDKRTVLQDPAEEAIGLHELNAAVALARTSRLLGVNEEKIVLSAAQLSRRAIKEIILPIADVSMIPLNSSLSEALIRAHNDMHTRFPVCEKEGDPHSIVGYINFKDIIAGLKINPDDPSVKGIIRPIKTVLSSTPISQVLEQMIAEKLHIALVASLNGTIGMVTLEDIIEELVGEIEDEFDRMPSYVHSYGDGWLMGGGVTMATLMQTAKKDAAALAPEEQKMKLADWFAQNIKIPLKTGEVMDIQGLRVTVRRLRRKKMGEALVHPVRN